MQSTQKTLLHQKDMWIQYLPLMRAQVQSRSGLVVNVLSVGETVRAVQETQVNKNANTHAETVTNMIVLVETAETGTRNAQMPSCIGFNVHPMLVTKSNVFDFYFTHKASFCINEGCV